MTDLIDIQTDTDDTVKPQAFTRQQRRAITIFGIISGFVLIAYITLSLQLNAEILTLSDAIARGLMHGAK